MLGERQFKDNLERSVDIMKYIESYSELSKRISEIEEKSSYDLFVKLYGSNISLKNELEQINSRYLKLYELAFEKSEYVEQLYNIRKLLNKPEIKILMLLSRYATRNGNPPFFPIRYGNFHRFPNPIAAPAVAIIKPSLLAHCLFLLMCSPLSILSFHI